MSEEQEQVILGVANAMVDLADLSGISPMTTVAGGLYEYTMWGFELMFKAGGVMRFRSGDKREVMAWHQRIKHAWGSLRGYRYYEGEEIAPYIATPTPMGEIRTPLFQPSPSIAPEGQESPQRAPILEVPPESRDRVQSSQQEEYQSPYTLLASRGRKVP